MCIKIKALWMLSQGKTRMLFKCDMGPIFQVTNLNGNLT